MVSATWHSIVVGIGGIPKSTLCFFPAWVLDATSQEKVILSHDDAASTKILECLKSDKIKRLALYLPLWRLSPRNFYFPASITPGLQTCGPEWISRFSSLKSPTFVKAVALQIEDYQEVVFCSAYHSCHQSYCPYCAGFRFTQSEKLMIKHSLEGYKGKFANDWQMPGLDLVAQRYKDLDPF